MYTFLYTNDLGYKWLGIALRVFSIGEQTVLVTFSQSALLYVQWSGSLLFYPIYKLNM
jgi:hypothetical protein